MIRYVLVGIGILAIIPVAWFAWWLLSPLFSTTEVYEDFPNAARATIPEGMTIEEVEVAMGVAAATDKPVDDGMPSALMESTAAAQDLVQAAGNFRDADSFHKGSGNAVIYQLSSGERILRLDDFRVTNGPDLRVLLVNTSNPESHGDLANAGYHELGKLKGNVGAQNYEIPDTVPLSDVESVVIYCKPFRVVFSVATLAKVET